MVCIFFKVGTPTGSPVIIKSTLSINTLCIISFYPITYKYLQLIEHGRNIATHYYI